MIIPYDTDLYVLTAWNGAGTPIVFSSQEACDEFIAMYDNFRADHIMPWVYGRGAANGDRISDLFKNGLRPWKVYLSHELKIVSIKAIPLQHIELKLVTARYEHGAPRYLEIWAANKDFAAVHTNNLLSGDKIKLLTDVDIEWTFEGWAAAQGFKAAPPVPEVKGLQDEVDFFSDEQKDKAAESLRKETAGHEPRHTAREEPSEPRRAPQPQVNIPGFGKVLDLNTL